MGLPLSRYACPKGGATLLGEAWGVSPVVGGSRSDTWISTAAVAVSLVTELLASTWVRKGTCSSWVPLYPTPLVPLSPLHLYTDGSRFLHGHSGQYDVLIHHEFCGVGDSIRDSRVEVLDETTVKPGPGTLLSTPGSLHRERRPEGPGIRIGFIGEQEGTAYRETWVLSLDPQDLRREGPVLHCCASLRTQCHCAIVQAQ